MRPLLLIGLTQSYEDYSETRFTVVNGILNLGTIGIVRVSLHIKSIENTDMMVRHDCKMIRESDIAKSV